jgi:hypothetical protein
VTSGHQHMLHKSLIVSSKGSKPDHSHNISRLTDRSQPSPSGLNSQQNSPRVNFANKSNISVRTSLRETKSYLDNSSHTPHNMSLHQQNTSSLHSKRKTMRDLKSTGFAFSFYKMPNTQFYNDSVTHSKFLKGKKDHFMTNECKKKLYVPSPDKYDVTGDLNMRDTNKRVFSKLPRLTIAGEILKKGSTTPGPGAYKFDFKSRKKQAFKQTLIRELGFINEAKYKGAQTPLCHDSNFKQVEKKARCANFRLSTYERSVKIEKKAGLSPVSYEAHAAFKKTQI